ncbi:MAG: type II secretion system secretin GspD [Proteobacteria bacterium]|nr:type II secretion system protein GspD [Pseudomonadota bacterium]NOG58869.1 type II secretion system secretin GspD [Pseudomonadota bacterium]
MEKRHLHTALVCTALLVSLTGCNLLELKSSDNVPEDVSTSKTWSDPQVAQETTLVKDELLIQPSDTVRDKRQQIVEIGNGQYTGESITKKAIFKDSLEGDITLNFQGTDINEFVKVILNDVLNLNFVIDPQVSGSVTIETATPVKEENLFPLLEQILSINNAAIIESNGIYQILPKSKVVKGNLSPQTLGVQTDNGYSVRIVSLEYIAAQEMQKILEPFIPEGGELRLDKQRNMIIIGGTPNELARLQETIDIFDVDWLRGMSVGLYPLDYVDPKTLKTELDEVLGGVEGSSSNEILGGLVRTVALERLNSLLLISSTSAALREAEIWLYRLDRQGEQVGQNLYVYDVQNAKAVEIADILGNIFDDSASTSQSSTPQLAPGTTPVEIATEGSPSKNSTTTSSISPPISVGDSGLSLTSKGDVEIIADDTRNALVILASSRDYKMVAAAIKKLDVVPLQVLVEASILEVTLNGDLSYGVEWFFNHGVGRSRTAQGQLDLGSAGLSALAPGFSYTIVNTASNIKAALNALESESEINVLSAPSLMVLDNQTATINVGDEIPVPTRQSTSNIDPNAPTVNEIQFRDTGITLEVTPRVNNSGLVTMDIRQEVSNAVATTSSDIDAPTIQQRQIESTVAINSGQTIILGGLIRDSITENEGGIPGLYKIPIIGKLFGNTSVEERRTELIVLLTPRVVRNNIDAKKITDEFRRKLYNLPPANKAEGEILIDEAS